MLKKGLFCFSYTWVCICFQHSSPLLWWISLKSNCIVPVSQNIALWLLWFRGVLPSFQKRPFHRGTSVTRWTWTQLFSKLFCYWADLVFGSELMVSAFSKRKIPHLCSWWSELLVCLTGGQDTSSVLTCTDNVVVLTSMYSYVFCKDISDFANKSCLAWVYWCQDLFLTPYLSGLACSWPGKGQVVVSSRHCYVLPLAESLADFPISVHLYFKIV